MVAIATSLQNRIIQAAEQHLGPSAEAFVREVCRNRLNTTFETLEYSQVNALLKAIELDAGSVLGRRIADSLAEMLLQIRADIEAGIPGRLVGSVARVLGPAAEPFMRNVCAKMGITLETVTRELLPAVARHAAQEAQPLLGGETAEALSHMIERVATARPQGLVASVVEAAKQAIGQQGEQFIRELCRRKLEIELDEIEPDGLELLAQKVRAEAEGLIGSAGAQAFAQAVAAALVSPNVALRAKLVEVARRFVGPAGEDFLRRSCRKMGMPWDAVDYEHLMWLAEVVRSESAPLIGKKQADEFARAVRGFLIAK